MKLEITTLPFSDDGGGFDQSRLQKLLSGKDVIDYNDHFFFYDGVPYLTMIVSYRDVESGRPFRRKEQQAVINSVLFSVKRFRLIFIFIVLEN